MTGAGSGLLKMWLSVILLLGCASSSLSSSDASVNPEDFDYGMPVSATLTGTSSKIAPGAQHYVSAPPLDTYNGYAYRPLPQYVPAWGGAWGSYGYGGYRFPPPYFGFRPPYYPPYPPFMHYGYGNLHGGYGGHYGGYGGHYGGYGGNYYGGHHYGGHGGHSQQQGGSDRSGKLYAGRNNFGSGFITQHGAGGGHVSAPAQYSQHIQQVADYIPIANQMSLAFDDPVTPYVGTHFTKAEPSVKYGMDMEPPSSGTAHLPSIYQPKQHTRRRRSLGSAGHAVSHPGYSVHPDGSHPGLHPAYYGGYGGQLYHPYWDTYYQRKAGYNPITGYGNYNPYVYDYQTSASLDDPLLTAHYPSSYYGYSLHQLPSLRPANPFANQAPGLALNPHYQYSRAAYRNFLHESMDGVDPVEYVKQSV